MCSVYTFWIEGVDLNFSGENISNREFTVVGILRKSIFDFLISKN